MRVTIPQHLSGKALTAYLLANKSQLIAKKKSLPITSDAVSVSPVFITPTKTAAQKADGSAEELNADVIRVKVVANTAWWCDSYMDVLTDSCWNKSIKEKGASIPHIADHVYKSTGHVGDVRSVYSQSIALKELGLNKTGSATALIWETDVRKDYNEEVFKFYKNGKINQHSIGLQYVDLELAIDDEESEKEYDFWKKYVDKVINKELVERMGYFWLVSEIKLLENSCVLFGANELTPTLEIQENNKGILEPDATPDSTTEHQHTKKFLDFSPLIN